MIDSRILRLTPKRIFCPLCGEWHDWEGKKLHSYDEDNPYTYECNDVEVNFWTTDKDQIGVSSDIICNITTADIDFVLDLDDMDGDAKDPIITIPFVLKTEDIVCAENCKWCRCFNCCNLVNLGEQGSYGDNGHCLKAEFKLEFNERYFNKYSEKIRAEHQKQVSANQCALKTKAKTTTNHVKEETTMANNIFNMNAELGLNKDESIAGTLMGTAVKNGDSWRIYSKDKQEITDVGDMQLGNFPTFIIPTTKLSEGDLIKDAGEYYFVIKVEKGITRTLRAGTGEFKDIIPIKNVWGFSCYSKVISLSDFIDIGEGFGVEADAEEMAVISSIMSATMSPTAEGGDQNAVMSKLLPMIFMEEKLGGDDDEVKMLTLLLVLFATAEGGDQNAVMGMLPMILMKGKLGGDDKKLKLLALCTMMCGGSNNPFTNLMMGLLMMDGFMGKKKETEPEISGGAAKEIESENSSDGTAE